METVKAAGVLIHRKDWYWMIAAAIGFFVWKRGGGTGERQQWLIWLETDEWSEES